MITPAARRPQPPALPCALRRAGRNHLRPYTIVQDFGGQPTVLEQVVPQEASER